METSIKGLVEIVGHEGICLKPYKDSVGVWTIGVGHTNSDGIDPKTMHRDEELTIKEAIDLFKHDIKRYENAVNNAVKVNITQEQFDALVSWCYNVGCGGMKNSTAIKRLNSNYSKKSVADAIMMWQKPKEIVGRRRKEAKLFEFGDYSNGGNALLFDVTKNNNPDYKNSKSINILDLL